MDIHPSCQKGSQINLRPILIERTDDVAQAVFTRHFNKAAANGVGATCTKPEET